jgi:protein transport protein SEC23
MVTVHELSSTEVPKSFVFKGTKDYDANVLQTLLGLSPASAAPTGAPAGAGMAPMSVNKFLSPIGECMMVFDQILGDLTRDPWPTAAGDRPARAVGAALRIAECVLEKTFGKQGGRIIMFMGGPCTVGPGQVVIRPLTETMRGHTEIMGDSAPFLKSATAFYNSIAVQAANNSHVIDIFACALDQVGLVEMKNCVTHTGGLCVLADSFKQSVFQVRCPNSSTMSLSHNGVSYP